MKSNQDDSIDFFLNDEETQLVRFYTADRVLDLQSDLFFDLEYTQRKSYEISNLKTRTQVETVDIIIGLVDKPFIEDFFIIGSSYGMIFNSKIAKELFGVSFEKESKIVDFKNMRLSSSTYQFGDVSLMFTRSQISIF